MANFESNEIINGLYGFIYDENGQELQSTQEFEASVEFEKAEIKQAGRFMTSHKVTSGKGKGSLKMLKIDSRLQKKIADNPTGKYNFLGKLADPAARGEEAVMFMGVSFDSVPLLGYKLGDPVEVELNFTFDSFRYDTYIA